MKIMTLLALVVCLPGCSNEPMSREPETHIVEIKAMQFQPAELLVSRNDTVLFVNRDFVVHDVTEADGKSWASPPLYADQTYRLLVTKNEDYYCTIHPVMKGKLIVR